jgi:hypothetical protein
MLQRESGLQAREHLKVIPDIRTVAIELSPHKGRRARVPIPATPD